MPTATLKAGPEVQKIAVRALRLSDDNTRQSYNEDSINELAASIASVGLLQPIAAFDDGEILFGHRRYLACLAAGLDEVDCIVRPRDRGLDAATVRTVENLQREDLHPMDEAEAILSLAQADGYTVADVAATIGKPMAYVSRRVALAELLPEIKECFRKGGMATAVAEEIARLEPGVQRWAFGYYRNEDAATYVSGKAPNGDTVRTLQELRNYVKSQLVRTLERAPFDIDAEWLDGEERIPSCEGCPLRTSNSILFAGDEGFPDQCTGLSCYDRKLNLHIAARLGQGLTALSFEPEHETALPKTQWTTFYGGPEQSFEGILVDGSRKGEAVKFRLVEAKPEAEAQQEALAVKEAEKKEKAARKMETKERMCILAAIVGAKPEIARIAEEETEHEILPLLARAAARVNDATTFMGIAKRRGWIPECEEKSLSPYMFQKHFDESVAPGFSLGDTLTLLIEQMLVPCTQQGYNNAQQDAENAALLESVAESLGIDPVAARSLAHEEKEKKAKEKKDEGDRSGEGASAVDAEGDGEKAARVPRKRKGGTRGDAGVRGDGPEDGGEAPAPRPARRRKGVGDSGGEVRT